MHLIELVPRQLDSFVAESNDLLKSFPFLDGVNVPDVLRLETRSHEAAKALLQRNQLAIPHIRAMDRPLEKSVSLVKELIDLGLNHVLIVSGDIPLSPEKDTFGIGSIALIQALRKQFPTLNVYAALDPYRQSFIDEVNYCRRKIQAGATGFFTQPFFDTNMARLFLDQLQDVPVFLGISPVLAEKSLHYWINKNKVVFPKSFELTLEYNVCLAKKLMALAKGFNQHVYLMPITLNAHQYLEAICSKKES